jgi:hypothetical protein
MASKAARGRPAGRGRRPVLWWLLCAGVASGALACSKEEQVAAAHEPTIVQWLDDPRVRADGGGAPQDGGAPDGRAPGPTAVR